MAATIDLELRRDATPGASDLVTLYEAVGWTAYTAEPATLARAVANAHFVATVWEGDRLVGLLRSLSDDVTVAYVQDILVHPSRQRAGVGRLLMAAFAERYRHVRQKVLLSEDDLQSVRLFQAAGFDDISTLRRNRLRAWVRYEGISLR